MDDGKLKTLTADGLKLMEELKNIRKFVRRNSTGSEISDNGSNYDNIDEDRDGPLLTKLKKRWAIAKEEEERKQIAEQIEKEQEEKVRQNRSKFITAIYKDKDVMNQAKSQLKQLSDARERHKENIREQNLNALKERIERLIKRQTEILSPEDLKKRRKELKKRLRALKEKQQTQRESSSTKPMRSKGARRHQKKNKMGNQTPTDKELKENKELKEWERIYKEFKEEVSRRDSAGNFPNVTQLKF